MSIYGSHKYPTAAEVMKKAKEDMTKRGYGTSGTRGKKIEPAVTTTTKTADWIAINKYLDRALEKGGK